MALFRAAQCSFRQVTPLRSLKAPLELNIRTFHQVTQGSKKQVSQSWQWLIAGSLVVSGKVLFDWRTVKCEARISPPIPITISEKTLKEEATFPWWQFFSEYLWPHIIALSMAVVTAFAVAILNTKIGVGIGSIVNVVSANLGGDRASGGVPIDTNSFIQQIKEPALNVIKLYVSHAAMTFSYIYSLALVGERVAASLRKDLFSSIVKQDMQFFDDHKSGEIVSRLSSDVQEFKSSFKTCVSQGLRNVTQTVGSAIALYQISPHLSGIMFIVIPSVILVGTSIGSILRKLSKMAQAQTAKATAVCDEAISNVRTVRSFAQEDYEIDRYAAEVDKAQRMNEWLGFGIGIFQSGTVMFLNGIVLGTLYYGGYLLSVQELTPGDLMAFLVSTQTIQRSLGHMSLLFGQFVRGVSAGTRVFEYINLEPTIPVKGGRKIAFHNLIGDVAFDRISFTYPTRPEQQILKDFSLQIPGGKIIALVGTSGGGKSTIASLLERFYDCDSGNVTIDGIDIKKLDPKWLRGKAIGYINQEPTLFATSIMENIRYGRPEATDVEVREAALAANAHEFITGFPKGYDTVVGERGVTVSGGQKQRIAIARALLKNPSILVLDEATSALDAESERIVQDALDTICKGRSVLVIAHRLSTIQNADVIAVLNNGKIAEMGTHQQLKRLGGLYSSLIKQQEQNS